MVEVTKLDWNDFEIPSHDRLTLMSSQNPMTSESTCLRE